MSAKNCLKNKEPYAMLTKPIIQRQTNAALRETAFFVEKSPSPWQAGA